MNAYSDDKSEIIQSLAKQMEESSHSQSNSRAEQPKNEPEQPLSQHISGASSAHESVEQKHDFDDGKNGALQEINEDKLIKAQQEAERLQKENADCKLYCEVAEKKIKELDKKKTAERMELEKMLRLKDEQLEKHCSIMLELKSRISVLEAEAEKHRSSALQQNDSMELTRRLRHRIKQDESKAILPAELMSQINKQSLHSCTERTSCSAEFKPTQNELVCISFSRGSEIQKPHGVVGSKTNSGKLERFEKLANFVQQTGQDDSRSQLEQQTGQDDSRSQLVQQTGQLAEDSQSRLEQQTGQLAEDSQSRLEQQTGQLADDSQSRLEQQTGQLADDSQSRLEQLSRALAELEATKLKLQEELKRMHQENHRLKSREAELERQCKESGEAVENARSASKSLKNKLDKLEEFCRTQKTCLNSYKVELEAKASSMRQMKDTILELIDRLGRHADEFDRKLIEENRKQEQLYRKMCDQSNLRLKAEQRLLKLKEEVSKEKKLSKSTPV